MLPLLQSGHFRSVITYDVTRIARLKEKYFSFEMEKNRLGAELVFSNGIAMLYAQFRSRTNEVKIEDFVLIFNPNGCRGVEG